jgi:hypothetical protein
MVMLVAVSVDNWETFGLAVLVALIGYLLDRRGRRIEVVVNGRYDKLVARTVQLEQELQALGHPVPPDPAVDLPPGQHER